MDYKEKYEQALERAKTVYNRGYYVSGDIEDIFPELVESKDEKIRKTLVRFFKENYPEETEMYGSVLAKEAIAWLDKQGDLDANIMTREDEILQALSIGLSDVAEKLKWNDFGGLPIGEIQNWLEKQKDTDALIQEASEKAYTEGMRVERESWLEKNKDTRVLSCLYKDPRYKFLEKLIEADDIHQMSVNDEMTTQAKRLAMDAMSKLGIFKLFNIPEKDPCDPCDGCNNYKGCVTCVDGDQWAHYNEDANDEDIDDEDYGIDGLWHAQHILEKTLGTVDGYETDDGILEHKCAISTVKRLREQELMGELEPKLEPNFDFKVGQWIVDNGDVYQITEIDGLDVHLADIDGNESVFDVSWLEDVHIWSMDDAKDGNILTNGSMTLIFKEFKEPTYKQHIVAYIGLDWCGGIQVTNDAWELGIDKATPATKEQRDLLFKEMRKSGYRWDADKKELKKIVIDEGKDEMDDCFTKMMNGERVSPAWSEEDSKRIDRICDFIWKNRRGDTDEIFQQEQDIKWLKSLKQKPK